MRGPRSPTGRRAGVTILELLIAVVLLALVMGATTGGFQAMSLQSYHAADTLATTRKALALMEEIRLELASLVMNPFADGRLHHRNSFVISRPHATSIQFVTERQDAVGGRKRYLVYYEAVNPPGATGPGPLVLQKTTWEFLPRGTWSDRLPVGGSWPAEWIGPLVEREQRRFQDLAVHDLRWQFMAPEEGEGRVYFRVKLVLATRGGKRLLPFTTLVSVPTPDLPTELSGCPCLFAPCWSDEVRDCSCCVAGTNP